jgi:hypothetical protein
MRGKSTSEGNTHSIFHVPSNFNPSHLITATQSAAISVTHIPSEPGARILTTASFPRPHHPHSRHTLNQHCSYCSKPVITARAIPADQSAFRLHEEQDLLPTVGYSIPLHLSKEVAQHQGLQLGVRSVRSLGYRASRAPTTGSELTHSSNLRKLLTGTQLTQHPQDFCRKPKIRRTLTKSSVDNPSFTSSTSPISSHDLGYFTLVPPPSRTLLPVT